MENRWFMSFQALDSPRGFSKELLNVKWGRGVVGCCKHLGMVILCSCSYPMWAWSWCSCEPSTRETLFCVLQLLISVWMEKCHTLKGQSLENGLSCIFQTIGSLLGGDMCACSVVSNSLRPHGLACQAPLSLGFSRQEYWSGLLFPGDLPDPEIKPASPT